MSNKIELRNELRQNITLLVHKKKMSYEKAKKTFEYDGVTFDLTNKEDVSKNRTLTITYKEAKKLKKLLWMFLKGNKTKTKLSLKK